MPKINKKPHVQTAINALKNEEIAITDKIKKLEAELLDIRKALNSFGDHMAYNRDSTWAEKIVFILKQKEKVMTVSEICEVIANEEPEHDFRRLIPVIRKTLMRLDSSDKVAHEKAISGKVYFGLEEWHTGIVLGFNDKYRKYKK